MSIQGRAEIKFYSLNLFPDILNSITWFSACLWPSLSCIFTEDDSETFGHSRRLRLKAVDELVNEMMNSINEPMALMYMQLQNVIESY